MSVLICRAGAIHIGAIEVFIPCLSDAGRSYTEVRRGARRNLWVMGMGRETNGRHPEVWDSCSFSWDLGE